MNSRTFAGPSIGVLAGRAAASLASVSADASRSLWDFLGALSPRGVRRELARMADAHAADQPEVAARLRRAAAANWYGEA